MSKISLFNSGDIGDLYLAMPILKHLGGGELVMGDRPYTRKITYFDLIKPLVEIQSYVECFRWERSGDVFTHNTSTFRPPNRNCTLTELMARHVNVWPVDIDSPWLHVEPIKNDNVYICLSSRYQNDLFPWGKIADFYRSRIRFVGLPEEHARFCAAFGSVAYQPIKDYLELARYLAGCFLYVGNQTSITAVAEGLKVPRIRCVCNWSPDCLYYGGNVQNVFDGYCTLPNDRGEPLVIGPRPKRLRDRSCGLGPNGFNFEKDGQKFHAVHWNGLMDKVRNKFPKIEDDEVDEFIAKNLGAPFIETRSADFSRVESQLRERGKLK